MLTKHLKIIEYNKLELDILSKHYMQMINETFYDSRSNSIYTGAHKRTQIFYSTLSISLYFNMHRLTKRNKIPIHSS